MNKKFSTLIKIIGGLLLSIFAILCSLFITMNSTIIYEYCIKKFDLIRISGLSHDKILTDYKTVINYIQNPFTDKLELKYFKMSESGEFHFFEVKEIFIKIYILIALIILAYIIYIVFSKKYKCNISFLTLANYSSNITFSIFILLIGAMVFDFTKAFEIFHSLFFNNDAWLFDPLQDPIINVLPEEVFMLNGIIILLISFIAAILFKVLYHNKKSKSISK